MKDAAARTMQFFADVLRGVLVKDDAGNLSLTAPVSAIVPTSGTRRAERQTFSGDWDSYEESRQPQSYDAYAIPIGTILVPSVGVNGVTVRGNAGFFSVPEAVLSEDNFLGHGTSTEIKSALADWITRHA